MQHILLYCRPGYEKECAGEIQDRSEALGVYGYSRLEPNSGYVLFECYQEGEADKLAKELPVSTLIFARQLIVASAKLDNLDPTDRISPMVDALKEGVHAAGRLWVETPDTNEAKELSKLCKKITVPLRQILRSHNILTKKESDTRPVVHVCFVATNSAFVGYSYTNTHYPYPMGIMRLRMPGDGPSRSTLKLDEAFLTFIPEEEKEARLSGGKKAVDLGACPGGWTYQLVRRNMMVSAVDHGPMAQSLMDTGQVKHFPEDGFKFEPERKNIYWLVCDMVDKPARVAALMEEWAIKRWCTEMIFNLKLPMKARYKEVVQILSTMSNMLDENGVEHRIACKHLYHDRDEVTVHLDLRKQK